MLRAIPELKEELELNIELACPADFIPELPGWEERSPYIAQEGSLSFYHYDLYAQALSKIERAHKQDLAVAQILPNLYRFPAIDPKSFRNALTSVLVELEGKT